MSNVVPIRDPHIDLGKLYASALSLYRTGGLKRGAMTGWPCVDELYTVAAGQWTVVTGIPQSGKSEWLDAMLVNLAERDPSWLFCVYSPENWPPETHLAKLVEKRVRKPFNEGPTPRMTEKEYANGAAWVLEHFLWLDTDLKSPEALLEAALSYRGDASRKLGVVLDPWNTLDHQRGGMNETDYVSLVLTEVTKLARETGAHVWLVVHPAKIYKDREGKRPTPTPYDISGCYSDDTEVLTRRGWLRHADINMDDEIAAFDRNEEVMVYQRPERIICKPYRGPMHSFRGYGFDLLVTPEHRMLLRPQWEANDSGRGRPVVWPKGRWSFATADAVPGGSFDLPLAAPLAAEHDGGRHVLSPLMAALAGWYVSEGSAVSSGVSICQAVGPRADDIDRLLSLLGIEATRLVSGPGGNGGTQEIVQWYIGVRKSRDVVEWLRTEGGIGSANKRVPDRVFAADSCAKRAFLDAYIAGDGADRTHGGWSATTTSRLLVDDLQRLGLELGMAVSFSPRFGERPDHHAESWQVNFSPDRRVTTMRTQRNHSLTEYEGNVWCLTLPAGAYFVRRNGRACVCGNSAHWYNKADNIITVHRQQGQPTQEVEIHVQKVRFKHIGHIGLATLRYDKVVGRYFQWDGPNIEGELYADPERRS